MAEGDVYGEIVFPARFGVLNARMTVVWGMVRDELDVPYIVKYSVTPGESPERGGSQQMPR